MMKLRSLFNSVASNSGRLRSMNHNSIQDVASFNAFMSRAGFSTAGQNTNASNRIFAPYVVYKGKAALSASPVPARFIKTNTGGLRVKRQGCIVLEFSPAVGERKYDWERKQLFALTATEVGSLISLGPNGSCEFFHDPGMKSSNAGQVRKSLSIKPHADGSGYFISLSVTNNILKTNERFTVPVTSAEFAVMRTSFSFAVAHILGWDRYSSQMPTLDVNSAKGPRSLDSEWDR